MTYHSPSQTNAIAITIPFTVTIAMLNAVIAHVMRALTHVRCFDYFSGLAPLLTSFASTLKD